MYYEMFPVVTIPPMQQTFEFIITSDQLHGIMENVTKKSLENVTPFNPLLTGS
jgi:hypothetical protein